MSEDRANVVLYVPGFFAHVLCWGQGDSCGLERALRPHVAREIT